MSNITQEQDGMTALEKMALEMDKNKKVERQESCNLDDGECLTCGS